MGELDPSSPRFGRGPLTGDHRYLWLNATDHKVRVGQLAHVGIASRQWRPWGGGACPGSWLDTPNPIYLTGASTYNWRAAAKALAADHHPDDASDINAFHVTPQEIVDTAANWPHDRAGG